MTTATASPLLTELDSASRIADFVAADDTVLIPSSLGLNSAQVRVLVNQDGADAVLTLGPGLTLTFVGVQAAAITAADFVIV